MSTKKKPFTIRSYEEAVARAASGDVPRGVSCLNWDGFVDVVKDGLYYVTWEKRKVLIGPESGDFSRVNIPFLNSVLPPEVRANRNKGRISIFTPRVTVLYASPLILYRGQDYAISPKPKSPNAGFENRYERLRVENTIRWLYPRLGVGVETILAYKWRQQTFLNQIRYHCPNSATDERLLGLLLNMRKRGPDRGGLPRKGTY